MSLDSSPDWELELAKFRTAMPLLLEYMALVLGEYEHYAKQYKAYFDALVARGFTPDQALEIVKVHGWVPK